MRRNAPTPLISSKELELQQIKSGLRTLTKAEREAYTEKVYQQYQSAVTNSKSGGDAAVGGHLQKKMKKREMATALSNINSNPQHNNTT